MIIDFHLVIAGAISGFLIGLTGVGGGAVTTPILLLIFGVSPLNAVATDLWFSVLTKLAGIQMHLRTNLLDWKVLRRFWLGSLPAALICAVVLLSAFKLDPLIKVRLIPLIGWALLVSALGMLISPYLLRLSRSRRITFPEQFKRWQLPFSLLAGAIQGIVVSLTSIGAGTLGSVMMQYLYPLRLTPRRLVVTDMMHAIPLSAVAGLSYLFSGWVDFNMLGNLLLGSIPAILIASHWLKKASEGWVRTLLSLVLIVTAVKIIL